MKITCDIEEVELEGEYTTVDGVCATCSKCDHQTESYGTSGASIRRCLVLMREECPLNEDNFYCADGDDE
jgi:hypothetical protein